MWYRKKRFFFHSFDPDLDLQHCRIWQWIVSWFSVSRRLAIGCTQVLQLVACDYLYRVCSQTERLDVCCSINKTKEISWAASPGN